MDTRERGPASDCLSSEKVWEHSRNRAEPPGRHEVSSPRNGENDKRAFKARAHTPEEKRDSVKAQKTVQYQSGPIGMDFKRYAWLPAL